MVGSLSSTSRPLPATRVVVAATRVKVLKVEYAGVAQSTQIDRLAEINCNRLNGKNSMVALRLIKE